MRAGVLGLCLHRDGDPLREFVRASTRITHTDPKAETGAMLFALGAREAYRARGSAVDAEAFLQICRQQPLEPEWLAAIEHLQQSLAAGESAAEFAARLNCQRGITGYIVHTVAAVLFCWLRWPGEFRRPMEEIILLGGDSDSTAAILGGLAGASCGTQSIPTEWISHLAEWPYSVDWMAAVLGPELQRRFGDDQPATPMIVRREAPTPLPRSLMPLAVIVRNVFFLIVVLFHGFRRLLPPY
jgi:ADP-ribosylglycohydrolase